MLAVTGTFAKSILASSTPTWHLAEINRNFLIDKTAQPMLHDNHRVFVEDFTGYKLGKLPVNLMPFVAGQ